MNKQHYHCIYVTVYIVFLLFTFLNISTFAQSTSHIEQNDKEISKDSTENKVKTISEVVKSCLKYPGLFNIYQDSTNGKVFMEISEDKIGKEFIHFFHVENSPMDAGWAKGAYGSESIIKIKKYFNKIEFVGQNPHYYFDPDNPISKAAGADINTPVISVDNIVAINNSKDTFLIEAENLFLTEALAQLKRLPHPDSKVKNPFKIGNLSKDKSRFTAIRNYPKNADVVVDYVYENKHPTNFGRSTITDPRYITIQVQHSLIQMPENDYQPRFEDPRIGYFTTQVTDQTSTSVTPYRDLIHRWHLVKKDPDAEVSEPVEPIVFWMENTTPLELRPVVKKGVEAWNIAFEKAGFKNAVVVKQQPDDAGWEAGDLRYNVLRWTAAPMMGSAWGPSFVNPRTGQILGADIMLDYVFIRGVSMENKVFGPEVQGLEELMFGQETTEFAQPDYPFQCKASRQLGEDLLFGNYLGKALGYSKQDEEIMEQELIIWLMLHEVGHTLGLNHNFRASQFRTPEELNNTDITNNGALSGSVMDYNANHYSLNPAKQGHYRNTVPGPYDLWAIEYGYSTPLKETKAEEARMDALLARSTEPELVFGNDGDAMGFPGYGIDPTIVRWDMSNDVIKYGEDLIQLSRLTMSKLKDKLSQEGKSYQELLVGYNISMSYYYRALNSIKHYIGGVKIDRAFVGQQNAGKPFVPISSQEQKRAMKALVEYGFSPRAFLAPNDLYAYLQIQRRGFDFRRKTEDPKIHDQIAFFQRSILAHLLHPTVLKRMTDSRLYGNTYTVAQMMSDLTEGIFKEDLNINVTTTRQNLQHIYVDGLISGLSNSKYDYISKSTLLYEIKKIEDMMKSNKGKNEETKAHRKHIQFKIDKALKHNK